MKQNVFNNKEPAMFKLENGIDHDDVSPDIDSDLLPGGSFSLEAVNSLFSSDPLIIASLVDSPEPLAPMMPVSPIGPPDRYPMETQSQFVVQINSSDVRRKKYLYSQKLNRIYVDIDTCFCIEFNWNQKRFFNGPMYVRAMVVFSDKAQAQKRVEVCVQHYHAATTAGKSEVVAKNVLLSSRSGTEGVFYCGLPERPDSWYSVLVEFNKTTDEPCQHAYQFVCKNSCSTGINRRSIDIIFTLEDKCGVVYGRQSVGARVCACPLRDIRKDEDEWQADPANRAHAKKRRTHAQQHLPLLPALPIVDKFIMDAGLTTMLRMTEQKASDTADPQVKEDCKKSIAALKKTLADTKNTTPS